MVGGPTMTTGIRCQRYPSGARIHARLARGSLGFGNFQQFQSCLLTSSSSSSSLPHHPIIKSPSNAGAAALLLATSLTAAALSLATLLENEEWSSPFSYQIDVDFMEKLARKPYLNFRNRSNSTSPTEDPIRDRPAGVPPSLRLLTIDLPEIAQYGIAGGEGCRLAPDRVYPNGTAPPKPYASAIKKEKGQNLAIEQKAWVTAMYECCTVSSGGIAPGVQILQASTAALNPKSLRHTHQVGSYRYDPGKYFARNKSPHTLHPDDPNNTSKQAEPSKLESSNENITEWDELEAPWHQYAWLEELQVRISGQVHFGETLEPSNWLNRLMWGHVYQRTVTPRWSVGGLFQWEATQRRDQLELEVGGPHCCTSQKPHAVIANGAALQRVPHALRWLQKTCRDHQVPLYVVRDPRTWGNNTVSKHSDVLTPEKGLDDEDLGPVLKQVRRHVKDRIVQSCLRVGTGFERGRLLGRTETNAKWQSKEIWRQAKQAFERPPDWRQLDERQLELKLRERGVVDYSLDDATQKVYSKALVSLARKCVDNENKSEKEKGAEKSNLRTRAAGANTDSSLY